MKLANRDLPNAPPGQPAGPADAKVLIVGEDFEPPTRLFTGTAGQSFRELLEMAKIPTRKCRFADTAAELEPALEGVPIRWVILSGDAALHLVRPDLDQRSSHGRVFSRAGVVYLPVFHYVAVYRHRAWRPLVLAELEDLVTIARGTDWTRFVADTCALCRGEFYRVDDEGIVFCEEHWQ